MKPYTRVRSDGAISIDLDGSPNSPSQHSNIFSRENTNNNNNSNSNSNTFSKRKQHSYSISVPTAIPQEITTIKHNSPKVQNNEMWFGNISSLSSSETSSETSSNSSSPQPRCPSTLIATPPINKFTTFNMKERLTQEEEWRALQECTFHPIIDSKSRKLANAVNTKEIINQINSQEEEEEEKEKEKQQKEQKEQKSNERQMGQSIFDKLYADAKLQEEKLQQRRLTKELEIEEKEREEMRIGRRDSLNTNSLVRKPRSYSNNNNNNNDSKEVFDRLYAEAERIRNKQSELRRQHEEKMMEEEEEIIHNNNNNNNKFPRRMTITERKELFARLSTPIRKRDKNKKDNIFPSQLLTEDNGKNGGQEERENEKDEPRQIAIEWPLTSIHTLTLADLRRHNKLVSHLY